MITVNLAEALKTNEFVLADFWLPGCGYCDLMMPALNDLAKNYPDVVVCKVNLKEEAPKFGETFRISMLPTFILFKNGREAGRLVGMQPFQVLEGLVKEAA